MKDLSRQGQKAAAQRNLEIAREAEKIAKRLVPVASGALKASIRVEQSRRTGAATLEVGNDEVDYAQYVEFGTRFMSAQPFISPAIDQAMKRTRNRMTRRYR